MKLGIDFGTCFSFAAACLKNTQEPTPLIGDSKAVYRYGYGIPTVFYNDDSNKELIGQAAHEMILNSGMPSNGVSYIKSKLRTSRSINKKIMYGNDEYSLKDIVVRILKFLIENAAIELVKADRFYPNPELESVVIAVPAESHSFSYRAFIKDCTMEAINLIKHVESADVYRESISKIGENATNIIRTLRASAFTHAQIDLIDEPVAAALSFYMSDEIDLPDLSRVLIFDLGGGTFDTAIVEYDRSSPEYQFKVLAQGGEYIGGNDWDEALEKHILDENMFTTQFQSVPSYENVPFRERVIDTKIELSGSSSRDFNFSIESIPGTPPILSTITQGQFENITEAQLEKTIAKIDEVLRIFKDKSHSYANIDAIVLSGGSSNMPMIMKRLEKFANDNAYTDLSCLNLLNSKIHKLKKPEQAIAFGAAIYAADPDNVEFVAPKSYGIEVAYSQTKTQLLWEYDNANGSAFSPNVIKANNHRHAIMRNVYGDEMPAVQNIIFINDEIDSTKGYISREATFFPIDNSGVINVAIYESNISQELIDKESGNLLKQFQVRVRKIKGIDTMSRSIVVELRLYKGGLLEIHVYDNEGKDPHGNRKEIKYGDIRV